MADKTKIEWAEASWNPFAGCSLISPGCKNCYAKRLAARNLPAHRSPTTGEPFAIMTPSGPRWTNKLEVIDDRLAAPTHWRKPRRIFVNSMSDTWHLGFSYREQSAVVNAALSAPQHTYLFLTKRSALAREFWDRFYREYRKSELDAETMDDCAGCRHQPWPSTPFQNVWMGASAEDQQRFDERIEHLRATPAAVRWLSLEPLLGPIDLTGKLDGIHWVVVGGESGPRECDVAWIRSIVRQCREAGVPVFVKQLGARPVITETILAGESWDPDVVPYYADGKIAGFEAELRDYKGGDPAEWPEDLRVREYPLEAVNG